MGIETEETRSWGIRIEELNKATHEQQNQIFANMGRDCIRNTFDYPFKMTDLENSRYKDFCNKHYHEGKQDIIQVILLPGTIATMVYVECKICEIRKDIFDADSL
jgi:hypothetical protein